MISIVLAGESAPPGGNDSSKSAVRADFMFRSFPVHRFEAGVKYACNPKTVVRAKVNSAGVVTACALNKCADKVSVAVTGQVRNKKREHNHTRSEWGEGSSWSSLFSTLLPLPLSQILWTPDLPRNESVLGSDQSTSPLVWA